MRDDGVLGRSPDATPVVEEAQGTLLRRGYRLPRAWHAVPTHRMAPVALCGFRYTREPHRTWKQTMIPRRCPKVPASRRASRVKRPGSLDEPALGCAFTRGRDTRSPPGRLRALTSGHGRTRHFSALIHVSQNRAMFRHTAHVYDLFYAATGKDYAAEAAALHELDPGTIPGRHVVARRGVRDRWPSRPSPSVVRGGRRGPGSGHARRSTTTSARCDVGRGRHASILDWIEQFDVADMSVQFDRLHGLRAEISMELSPPWFRISARVGCS